MRLLISHRWRLGVNTAALEDWDVYVARLDEVSCRFLE
jgi:hypothetical protein